METCAEKRLELKGPHTKEDFLRLSKKCKDKHLAWKYHAFYLSFTYSWKEIADILAVDYRTVLEWVKQYNEKGIDGLLPDIPSGRQESLSSEQKNQLKEIVKQSPRSLGYRFSNWTAKGIAGWVADKLKVVLSAERIRQILHEIGFSFIKPSYNYTRADKAEQEAFRYDLLEAMSGMSTDDVLMFQDETTVSEHPGLHGMWVLKGNKPKIDVSGTHRKQHVFGAVNPVNGRVVEKVSRRLTANAFIGFLKHLLNTVTGNIILGVDGSPCHKAKKTLRFLEKHSERITVLWLPGYSPDLNPIEQLWGKMKFAVTHNWVFNSLGKLMWAVKGYLHGITPEDIKSLCSVDYLFGRL